MQNRTAKSVPIARQRCRDPVKAGIIRQNASMMAHRRVARSVSAIARSAERSFSCPVRGMRFRDDEVTARMHSERISGSSRSLQLLSPVRLDEKDRSAPSVRKVRTGPASSSAGYGTVYFFSLPSSAMTGNSHTGRIRSGRTKCFVRTFFSSKCA